MIFDTTIAFALARHRLAPVSSRPPKANHLGYLSRQCSHRKSGMPVAEPNRAGTRPDRDDDHRQELGEMRRSTGHASGSCPSGGLPALRILAIQAARRLPGAPPFRRCQALSRPLDHLPAIHHSTRRESCRRRQRPLAPPTINSVAEELSQVPRSEKTRVKDLAWCG